MYVKQIKSQHSSGTFEVHGESMWCLYAKAVEKFLENECQKYPWTFKKEGQELPLPERILKLLSEKFFGTTGRLAFIANHTQEIIPRGRIVRFLAFHYILRRCTVAGRLHNPPRTNFIRRIFTYAKSGTKPRSFSLAGVMDTKLRLSLPDHSRRLTTLLMFNGDIEGRFV